MQMQNARDCGNGSTTMFFELSPTGLLVERTQIFVLKKGRKSDTDFQPSPMKKCDTPRSEFAGPDLM